MVVTEVINRYNACGFLVGFSLGFIRLIPNQVVNSTCPWKDEKRSSIKFYYFKNYIMNSIWIFMKSEFLKLPFVFKM